MILWDMRGRFISWCYMVLMKRFGSHSVASAPGCQEAEVWIARGPDISRCQGGYQQSGNFLSLWSMLAKSKKIRETQSLPLML